MLFSRRKWIGTTFVGAAAAARTALGEEPQRETHGRLASLLEPIRKAHGLPALAAAVVQGGELKAVGVVGRRKIDDPKEAAVHDQFHLGSCTKAMTATLVAMLVEQGKLSWSTPLAKALPNYADSMHADFRAVTIDLLLGARGGFPGETAPKGKTLVDVHEFPGKPYEQRRKYVSLILAQGPEAKPGSKYIYSNAGYTVAGAVVEYWTKSPWEIAIRKMLFTPLGMTSAGFGAMGKPGKVDQPWQHLKKLLLRKPIEPGPHSDNPPAIAPAGRVHCSISDWAKFAILHLGGGPKLLTPASLKELHTALPGQEYAFGWVTADRAWGGGSVLTHAGSNTMNYAVIWLAPLKNYGVLIATNQGDADKACDDAAAALITVYPPG